MKLLTFDVDLFDMLSSSCLIVSLLKERRNYKNSKSLVLCFTHQFFPNLLKIRGGNGGGSHLNDIAVESSTGSSYTWAM